MGAIALTGMTAVVTSCGSQAPSDQSQTWYVLEVIDGGTLLVSRGGEEREIDLCEVDVPGLNQPGGEEAMVIVERLTSAAEREVILVMTGDGEARAAVFNPSGDQEILLQAELLMMGLATLDVDELPGCPNGDVLKDLQATEPVSVFSR